MQQNEGKRYRRKRYDLRETNNQKTFAGRKVKMD